MNHTTICDPDSTIPKLSATTNEKPPIYALFERDFQALEEALLNTFQNHDLTVDESRKWHEELERVCFFPILITIAFFAFIFGFLRCFLVGSCLNLSVDSSSTSFLHSSTTLFLHRPNPSWLRPNKNYQLLTISSQCSINLKVSL